MFSRPSREYLVTCGGRDDGGGAQIVAQISTIIYCRQRGYTYVHSPLSTVAHAPPGVTAADWAARWEGFFSLGVGETSREVYPDFEEVAFAKPHRRRPRARRINRVGHCHKASGVDGAAWARMAPEIRAKYDYSPKRLPPGFDPALRHIAVHLRRGDVGADGPTAERFTPLESLVEPLRAAIGERGRKQTALHVFSQGKPEDFAGLEALEPRLHLDIDVFEAFHGMVAADLLFTAKSALSYLAGVLNSGEVVYDPFWHPPLPGWRELA